MPKQRLYQRIYQVKLLLKSLFKGKKSNDDFDWDLYTQHYKGELKQVEEIETTTLKTGDYHFENGSLVKKTGIKPLHTNHQLLYETILQLHPHSVLEIGCGGGDHLANLELLNPELVVNGEDLSSNQIAFLHERHPGLKGTVKQHSIVSEQLLDWPAIDLVYSQAVIMHINTGDNHRRGLMNMFSMADKYVVLMENWFSHDFVKDIKELMAQKKLNWSELHLYSRPYPNTDKPYLLIASRQPLTGYQELSSDEELRQV